MKHKFALTAAIAAVVVAIAGTLQLKRSHKAKQTSIPEENF